MSTARCQLSTSMGVYETSSSSALQLESVAKKSEVPAASAREQRANAPLPRGRNKVAGTQQRGQLTQCRHARQLLLAELAIFRGLSPGSAWAGHGRTVRAGAVTHARPGSVAQLQGTHRRAGEWVEQSRALSRRGHTEPALKLAQLNRDDRSIATHARLSVDR
jgi:hypothetical protein